MGDGVGEEVEVGVEVLAGVKVEVGGGDDAEVGVVVGEKLLSSSCIFPSSSFSLSSFSCSPLLSTDICPFSASSCLGGS